MGTIDSILYSLMWFKYNKKKCTSYLFIYLFMFRWLSYIQWVLIYLCNLSLFIIIFRHANTAMSSYPVKTKPCSPYSTLYRVDQHDMMFTTYYYSLSICISYCCLVATWWMIYTRNMFNKWYKCMTTKNQKIILKINVWCL